MDETKKDGVHLGGGLHLPGLQNRFGIMLRKIQ